MHRITSVSVGSGPSLELRFADVNSGTFDLRPLIVAGGVFESLRDSATASRVRIGEGGRSVEWPGEIDLCADALWLAVRGAKGAAA